MIDFCNNEEWLAAYLDRHLTTEEHRAYEKHIADCPACLAALLNAKRELDDLAGTISRHPVPGFAVRRQTHVERDSPQAVPPARKSSLTAVITMHVRHAAASYCALGASIAMVLVLGLIMFSPAWDPELRTARAEINTVLSATQLGELRLAGGRDRPPGASTVVRGSVVGDHRRFDRLEKSLNKLLRRYPRNPEIHHLLGHLHVALNRLDRAEVSYRRAARLAPDDGRAFNDLAVIAYRRGSADSAVARLIDATQCDVVPPEVYYNLGIINHLAGQSTNANRYFELYIRKAPSSRWAAKARTFIKE